MTMNIKIHEYNILQGDTSPVRKDLEFLSENTTLIKKYQNSICLTFMNFTLFDIVRKLRTEEYRNWFKKLDRDIPGLPLFLSDENNSLLIFLMGNIAFTEKEGGIRFDNIEANRFFKEKQAQIRNLCLSNNVNPESALNRISAILSGRSEKENSGENSSENKTDIPKETTQSFSAENENGMGGETKESQTEQKEEKPKKSPVKDLLDKYGSIAYLTNDRAVKITIALNDLPDRLAFSQNFLVKDSCFPQSFFSSVLSTEKGNMEVRSIIIPDMRDVESSIEIKKGVQIQVVYKVEDGSYQKIFESDKIFPVKTTASLDNDLKELLSVTETVSEETVPDKKPDIEQEEPEQDKTIPAEPAEHIEPVSDIERLTEENNMLKEKISKLEKLLEVYEDEIHKKRSVKGFFKKFIG